MKHSEAKCNKTSYSSIFFLKLTVQNIWDFLLGCFALLNFKCPLIIIYDIHYLPLFYFSYAPKIPMLNLWYFLYLSLSFVPFFIFILFSFSWQYVSFFKSYYILHWIYSRLRPCKFIYIFMYCFMFYLSSFPQFSQFLVLMSIFSTFIFWVFKYLIQGIF